jgi:hypothetical protein
MALLVAEANPTIRMKITPASCQSMLSPRCLLSRIRLGRIAMWKDMHGSGEEKVWCLDIG